MNETRSTRRLILAALVGLLMTIAFVSHAQPAQHNGATTATESAPAAPEVAPLPAPEKVEKAPEVADRAPDVAAAVVEAPESDTATAAALYEAIKAGKWIAVAGLALLLLVSLFRRFGGKWASTKIGGYTVAFATAGLGALGLSLISGQWSFEIFIAALGVAFTAGGMHRAAKNAIAAKKAASSAPTG